MLKKIAWVALAVGLLLFSLTGCDESQSGTPVINVDQQHADLSSFYEIPSGSGFVLDLGNYQLVNPSSGFPAVPNYIQVVMVPGTYGQDWPAGETRLSVSTATLQPFPGVDPLSGFVSGEQFFVAIGEKGSDGLFSAYWMGAVTIK